MTQTTLLLIGLLFPLLIGGIIAAINSEAVDKTTEKAESWIRKRQKKIAQKSNWLSRFISRPIYWFLVKFFDWTDDFVHSGLKNGIRIASTLYLFLAWAFILYVAFIFVISIILLVIIVYIALSVFGINIDRSYSRQETKPQMGKEEENLVGIRGKKIYSGTNWFNEELEGRVDEEGNIYSGTNWFNEEKIGRIDEDGTIYKGTSFINEEKVGRIDEDGNIHKGTNWFNEEKTGRIDKEGNIYKGSNWLNEEQTGKTGG